MQITSERLAELFHENYERLAPEYGYKTRDASAKPWEEVPETNRRLMVAVAGEVLTACRGLEPQTQGLLDAIANAPVYELYGTIEKGSPLLAPFTAWIAAGCPDAARQP